MWELTQQPGVPPNCVVSHTRAQGRLGESSYHAVSIKGASSAQLSCSSQNWLAANPGKSNDDGEHLQSKPTFGRISRPSKTHKKLLLKVQGFPYSQWINLAVWGSGVGEERFDLCLFNHPISEPPDLNLWCVMYVTWYFITYYFFQHCEKN